MHWLDQRLPVSWQGNSMEAAYEGCHTLDVVLALCAIDHCRVQQDPGQLACLKKLCCPFDLLGLFIGKTREVACRSDHDVAGDVVGTQFSDCSGETRMNGVDDSVAWADEVRTRAAGGQIEHLRLTRHLFQHRAAPANRYDVMPRIVKGLHEQTPHPAGRAEYDNASGRGFWHQVNCMVCGGPDSFIPVNSRDLRETSP